MNILVTGGCGFIGSNYLNIMVRRYKSDNFICFDNLTYAGNLDYIEEISRESNFSFVKGDITKIEDLEDVFSKNKIDLVLNFAAETHVDNSISNPTIFYKTNVLGVVNLLEMCKKYHVKRLHQVSTDEVYGDLEIDSTYGFKEEDALNPNSPYSSSKAAADLIVLAYHKTYNMDVTISRSVNNYGKNQHEEKFIPKVIKCLKNNEEIPVYGDGKNIRSWIDVNKNNEYIDLISRYSNEGEIYNISEGIEHNNLELIELIANNLNIKNYKIKYVKDRPHHDKRLALDNSKLKEFILSVEEGRI